MKLNPDKFRVGKEVEFGVTTVKKSPSNERIQISPSETKVEELLGREPQKNKERPPIHSRVIKPIVTVDPTSQMQNPPDA